MGPFAAPCCGISYSYSDLRDHDHEVYNYGTECNWVSKPEQPPAASEVILNSKLYHPSTIVCPSRKCNRRFISPAVLTLHFESGACRSPGMTRMACHYNWYRYEGRLGPSERSYSTVYCPDSHHCFDRCFVPSFTAPRMAPKFFPKLCKNSTTAGARYNQ